MEEIFKPIYDFEGRYEISNLGNIKSLKRKFGNGKGYYRNNHLVILCKDQDGYLYTSAKDNNGKKRHIFCHKEVVRSFISKNFNSKNHICHKDGNPANNYVNNLYIGNVITNTIDKYRHGKTKITIEQIIEIKRIGRTKPQKEVANIFGIKQSYVSRILSSKRCWYIKSQTELKFENNEN